MAAVGYWPPQYHGLSTWAHQDSDAAHQLSARAQETRQPSLHLQAVQAHMRAAAGHRVAAGALHKQVAGTSQALALEHHQLQVNKHMDWARHHQKAAVTPAADANPKLTYGQVTTGDRSQPKGGTLDGRPPELAAQVLGTGRRGGSLG